MTKLRAELAAVIDAPPARIYAILADYRGAHHRILPKTFFQSMEVEQGGRGEGTVIRVTSRVLGVESSLRMVVAEPEPGRVLTESDLDRGLITAFTIDPLSAASSRVTIATVWMVRAGLAGFFERLVMPGLLRRVYRAELALLAAVATEPAQ